MSHIDCLNQIKVHQFCNRYLNIVYLLKLHNKKLLNEPMKVPVSVIAKVLSTTLAIDFVSIIWCRPSHTYTPTQCLFEWQTFSNANTTTSKCQHLEGRYRSNTRCDDLDAYEGRNIKFIYSANDNVIERCISIHNDVIRKRMCTFSSSI